MILFLLLLIVAGVGVAMYAAQNTASHDVTLLQWHWSAVPDWVPVIVTAAVIGGLFLLYMIYSGMVHGVRVGSMRRGVSTRGAGCRDPVRPLPAGTNRELSAEDSSDEGKYGTRLAHRGMRRANRWRV